MLSASPRPINSDCPYFRPYFLVGQAASPGFAVPTDAATTRTVGAASGVIEAQVPYYAEQETWRIVMASPQAAACRTWSA